ncbi:MAG TPA: Tad domain-containing protein [Nocardioidaceae bacterium]|nr:Tad domain-containing protein [Nocardioidaceae bacterium]
MSRSRDQRGAIAIVMSVASLMIFGFAALVVDLANVRDVKRQSQNTADAAVLAAGNALYPAPGTPDVSAAVAAAKLYAESNYGIAASEWDTCVDASHFVVPPGGSQCISFSPNLTAPTTVRVVVPTQSVRTPFASIMGVQDLPIATKAHATIDPGGHARCGLCVLGQGMLHDLQNGDATVHGADIHLNGSVNVGPQGLVATSGIITVQGTASGGLGNYVPDPLTGQPGIADPLAFIPLPPNMTGLTAKTDPCGTGAGRGPGLYAGRNLRNLNCQLQPGLYVIAGDSSTIWDLAGSSSTHLWGSGVTLYFTCGSQTMPRPCNAGEQGAWMDASGNGRIGIRAPTAGPLSGLAVIYDRQNASELRLSGNGSDNLTGTMYAASGALEMNGNGCSTNYYAMIVVKDLEMDGNPACLQSTYTQNQNVQIPAQALHLSQ